MRRLSVNGIENGEQPLLTKIERLFCFINGTYNSPKLRSDLQKKGHKFSSNSDGEVICHLWEEYQEDCFGYLDGMFAASIWLCNENKLILSAEICQERSRFTMHKLHQGLLSLRIFMRSVSSLSFLCLYLIRRFGFSDFLVDP